MTNSQKSQSEKLGSYRGRENAARTPRNEKFQADTTRATRARGRQKLGDREVAAQVVSTSQ
jgi:hypothetical protein